MLRSVTSFRGEVPLITPRALPEGASQAAVNSRLYTGDLTAFKQFSLTETLANAGPVQTISLMAAGTPYEVWLSWDQQVDVARGTVPGDTTYRTYLTGLDAPRFTNLELATTGGPPYPGTTRLLGVPPPDTVPLLVVGVDPTPTTFSVDIYDDCSDLSTNWAISPGQVHSGSHVSEVLQDAAFGNPAPSFQVGADNNNSTPAYASRDFGTSGATVIHASWDLCVRDVGSNAGFVAPFMFACDATGNGPRIFAYGTLGGSIEVGVAVGTGFAAGNGSLLASGVGTSGSCALSEWYTVDATLSVNANGTMTIDANVSLGSAQLASVTTTNTFTYGGVFGPMIAKGDDYLQVNYDNILVQAAGSLGTTITDIATSYVYTFVNDLGEESAPSLPSATVLRPDGISVTVTTPTSLPSGVSESDYFVETKRIYRAATGSTGTAFLFVAEIPLLQADYVDVLTDTALGEVLPSDIWELPPSDLRGILALPNGVMVGFSKNQLCFSAQNYPHAWPVSYRLNTDTDIVGIGNIDTTVVVGTKSFLYTASGNAPASYSMSKFEVPHAASSLRSFAYITGLGVVFSGPQGLMVVRGIGQASNLTEEVFTLRQWKALDPTSISSVAHDDIYFMFWDNGVAAGCYAIDLRQGGFGVVELALHATAAYVDPITDTMYLVLDQDNEPESYLLPPSQFLLQYAGGGGGDSTPSGVQPPGFDFVTALVRGNGDILDYSSNHGTMTYLIDNVSSAPVFSTTAPLLFEQPMLQIGGSGTPATGPANQLRIPNAQLALGTGDFTLEGWWAFDAGSAGGGVGFISWGTNTSSPLLEVSYVIAEARFIVLNSNEILGYFYGGVVLTNGLHFLQLERQGTRFFLWVDDHPWQAQNPAFHSIPGIDLSDLGGSLGAFDLYIGEDPSGDSSNYQYVGEIRVSTGTALTDHSVPAGAFPSPGYTPPTPPSGTPGINGITIFQFEGSDTELMIYRWRTKLWLEPYPAFRSIAQVRAESYTNLVARFYGDGVLLDEIVIDGETEFTLTPPDAAYSTFEMELIGTDIVRELMAADDVLELDGLSQVQQYNTVGAG